MLCFLLEIHPLQHSLVDDCSTFSNTPYPQKLLLVHMYALYSKFLLWNTSLHICIHDLHICGFHRLNCLSKLIVPIENNFGFVAKMISSSSIVTNLPPLCMSAFTIIDMMLKWHCNNMSSNGIDIILKHLTSYQY
jgi:hypothetical protein